MTARIPQGNEGTNRAQVRRNDRRHQQPFPGRSMPVRRSIGVPRRRSY
ncbi:hypothetical protein ACFWIW_18160 [Amycolatopsis sp. NPDC058340]|nr:MULTISPECIES: hypothetical protein [Amycolatopsis]